MTGEEEADLRVKIAEIERLRLELRAAQTGVAARGVMTADEATSSTSLVEQLRRYADDIRANGERGELDEAADEIERLRAALKEIADMHYDNTSAATMACRALEGK
jgi:hypothetical protein